MTVKRRLVGIFGITTFFICTAVALGAGDAADKAMQTIRPEAIRTDMRFLADDLLEGRGTGSRGYDIAAKFLASQFEMLGLKPAGDNATYLQQVPFRSMTADSAKTTVTWVRGGKEETLAFAKDFTAYNDPMRAEMSVEASVVFAGFGITAPDQKYDDYKNINAKGKIVAILFGAPGFPSAIKAHYSSTELKARTAAEHGAVGVIVVNDPILERMYSFDERVRDLAFPQLRWLDKQGKPNDYFPELQAAVSLSMEATRRFFEGSAHSAEEIYAAAKAGNPPTFDIPMTVKVRTVTNQSDTSSPNVAAVLEGSDPSLKNEYIVYSAHLDHLGIGQAVKGDKIYNGFLDNASGSATLLEVARAFSTINPKPKRSIVFVAVTGEEAGLLGSDYYAHYPTVPKQSIVANVNVDEVLMLWPMVDVIGFGAEHSSLGEVLNKAAARMKLTVSPDPMPEEVIFIRSDQYSFVKQGIPAVMPTSGFKSRDPKIEPEKIFANWEQTRYHQPQDDMDQPGLDWDAAADFARFSFLCGYLVAQDPQRPTWNKGDFFGDTYGKK